MPLRVTIGALHLVGVVSRGLVNSGGCSFYLGLRLGLGFLSGSFVRMGEADAICYPHGEEMGPHFLTLRVMWSTFRVVG